MLSDIFLIILNAVYWVLMPAALLRFYMQLRSLSFRGALGQYVRAITDWIVLPLRRIFKGAGYDWASLITAFLFELVYVFLKVAAKTMSLALVTSAPGVLSWLIMAIIGVVISAVVLMMILLFLYVVLSLLVPRDENLIANQMGLMVTPWLRPFRRFVPVIGNVDFSPLALGVVLSIIYLILDKYFLNLALALPLMLR